VPFEFLHGFSNIPLIEDGLNSVVESNQHRSKSLLSCTASEAGTMSDEYEGCRLFLAPDGLSGFALQAKGDLAGHVWDFFVSPEKSETHAYEFLLLAIKEGGSKVTTYDHPLSPKFFELFGFQAVLMSKGSLGNVVHMIYIDDFYEKTKPRISEALQLLEARNIISNASNSVCAYCGHGPQTSIFDKAIGGYQCPRCGFIRIWGDLTLGRPKPA